MTETTPSSPPARSIPKGAGNVWTDIGPVLAFVIVFNVMQNFADETGPFSKETAIFWATGVFMASVAAAIGWTLFKGRRLPPMLVITGVVVMTFGGLTLWLQDETFAFIKPTIINMLFAVTILGSLAIGRVGHVCLGRRSAHRAISVQLLHRLSRSAGRTRRDGGTHLAREL